MRPLLFRLSLAFGAGSFVLGHHELGFSLRDAGLWVELVDERGKAQRLEEEAGKTRVVCDHLWKELQVKATVSMDGQTTLVEREQECR